MSTRNEEIKLYAKRLRDLADQAYPGPWEVCGPGKPGYGDQGAYVRMSRLPDGRERFRTLVHVENAPVIALAPEMALILADMTETMEKLADLAAIDANAEETMAIGVMIVPLVQRLKELVG